MVKMNQEDFSKNCFILRPADHSCRRLVSEEIVLTHLFGAKYCPVTKTLVLAINE